MLEFLFSDDEQYSANGSDGTNLALTVLHAPPNLAPRLPSYFLWKVDKPSIFKAHLTQLIDANMFNILIGLTQHFS